MKWSKISLLFLLIAVFASACSAPTPAPTPTPTLDPAVQRGLDLFGGKGRCATCHSLTPDFVIVGPSLAGIASRAETRIPGWSARDYIEDSILSPNNFRVAGFEATQMDVTIGKQLTVDELNDLLAYLLTLK